MALFSWFKSKSGSSKRDEPKEFASSKPAPAASDVFGVAQDTAVRPGALRLREIIPQSSRTVSGSSPFKRPLRATIDVPLQTLWQSLPQGIGQENHSLDPRRRIQIPRKEVRINDLDHTGTVSLFVLHAVCPEIFLAPIPALDNRCVRFQLPAWERLRNVEAVEVRPGAVPVPQPEKPPTDPQLSEKQDRVAAGQNVRIALSPILRHLSPELNRPALHSAAGSNREIELPFELIRSQLSNGRVTVPISIFLAALPETVRSAFGEVDQTAQVPIPLKEIFRHLPSDALSLRPDQEMDEVRNPIDTPFSTNAREDAERFRSIAISSIESEKDSAQLDFGDSAKSDKSEALSDIPEPAAAAPAKPEADFSALQTIFLTDERLDLPIIISKISALPGLQAALLHTADGRRLIGAIGDNHYERAALTLFPVFFGQVKAQLDEGECGGLETLTFCWRQEQISVFSDGRLCLSVRHNRRPFKPGVREKLSLIFSRLTEAMSSSEI